MARYGYRGLDGAGQKVQGVIEAAGRVQAVDDLRRQGLFATRLWT